MIVCDEQMIREDALWYLLVSSRYGIPSSRAERWRASRKAYFVAFHEPIHPAVYIAVTLFL
jgi:hypothetical protein